MASVDARLLAESYELVLERDQEFPVLFYEILFERHPEVRPLFFRNTLGAQRKMLGQTLMAIVDHFDDETWLARTLAPLGKEHVGYGVTTDMYAWVGDALIEALARVCADDWSPAYRDAWTRAYQEIVRHMRG